ncbi:hypothetical protein ASE01_00635 [Nocardioides sp. Root190]|nr:hypothetical protein ASE01_00635 [Nocardioides sp. Root190]
MGFALLYAFAMYAGRLTRVAPSELALAWPAGAVTVVWMLTCRRSGHRLVVIVVIAIVSGAINQATAVEPVGSWLFGFVNASQGWVGALVLHRVAHWTGAVNVRTARQAFDLALASVAGGSVSAVAGGVTAWARFDTGLWDGMWLIGVRNSLSAFVLTGALLAVPSAFARVRRQPRVALLPTTATLLTTALVMTVSWPVVFVLIPPLLWVALRCGPAVVSVVVAAQGVIVVAATTRGVGAFGDMASAEQRVLLAQGLILVLAIVGLVVSLAQDGKEEALAESRRDRDRLHGFMEAALVAAAHVAVSADRTIGTLEVNSALASLTGRRRENLIGTDPATWFTAADAVRLREGITSLHPDGTVGWRAQLRLSPSHGGGWVDAGLAFVDGVGDGSLSSQQRDQTDWLKLQMVDITAQKHAEQELARIALHDELTGLANRTLWADRVEQALQQAVRTGELVAVLYVDVDHFKQINDTYGHDIGDEVLKEVASRISGIVRPLDIVARIGGDEFVVLCPALSDGADGRRLAARILETFRAPVEVGRRVITVSASIGVAFATDGDARSLLRRADSALYAAKDGGRARFEVYSSGEHDGIEHPAQLLLDLERGHRRGEFELEYQPIVDAESGRTVALEALLRWNHPDRGRLLPSSFLDVLEASELIHPVGDWILRQACADGAELLARGNRITMHVNISPRELSRPHVVHRVSSALADAGLPAGFLVLEITETRLFTVNGSLLRELEQLRDLGVRLAVDDFGTGFGTLSHLVDLPVSIAKLDRSFVVDIVDRPNARSVSNAVRSLADGLCIDAIAEGVETEAQAAVLRELGYRYLQGFLFGRSAPVAAVHERLDRVS